MGSGHSHSHSHSHDNEVEVDGGIRRLLAATSATIFVVVVTLVAITWPSPSDAPPADLGGATTTAVVRLIEECPAEARVPDVSCAVVRIEPMEGPDIGQLFELPPVYDDQTGFEVGERIVVDRIEVEEAPFRYVFVDRDRKTVIWVLAAVFALAVVGLGGLRGFRALLGLMASMLVLGLYTMPALLEGGSPLVVACLTAGLVAFAALYLAHGLGPMTSVAVLGTIGSLTITVVIGWLFIRAARFSGFTSDEAFFVQAAADQIDLRGLLLAGLVIGALGALDDMTVTQASVVFELKATSPTMPRRALFARAMRVGRDHVASTVNTLFLAYAGASMPLLLLFVVGDLPLVDVLNSEIVATEVVRTLVGSLGLVASVPLTTMLGVWVVSSRGNVAVVEPASRPPRGDQIAGAPRSGDEAAELSLWERLRKAVEE